MKLDIYKEMKLEGKPVLYETDTGNVYTKAGDFLCVGLLDDNKLSRATITGEHAATPELINKNDNK